MAAASLAYGNAILDALPQPERHVVASIARRATIPVRRTLQQIDAPLTELYFPLDSALSLVSSMSDGDAIEVGMVGREGAVGAEASIGTDRAAIDAICQSTGDALIVEAGALLPLLPKLPQLERSLRSQVDVQLRMATRTAACNRFHTVPERLAKWLGFMDDRIPNRPLAVTHDIIAIMLGARRAGVTEAAGRLQEQGIIRYAQGRVHILDGERLRNEACACYAVMRDLSQRGIAQAMDVAVGDYAGRAATGTDGGGGSVVT